MAVEIDEAGRDDSSGRVDGRAGVLRGLARQTRIEHAHPVAFDDDGPGSWRRTGPIDDGAAGDEEVDAVGHVADRYVVEARGSTR